MKNLHYDAIPNLERWKEDSSVALAWRSQDVIVTRLDFLIGYYDQVRAGGISRRPVANVVLADIFLTANAWITGLHQGQNVRMDKGRYRAVLALFQASVDELKPVLRARSEVEVANKMKLCFGRHMSEHGYTADTERGQAKYLPKKEREVYRLRFKGGLVYQLPWWNLTLPFVPTLVNSTNAYLSIRRPGGAGDNSVDYGGFVMTLNREMYMAQHFVGDINQHNGIFHSSYTGGDLVQFAGTMLIKNGRIEAIRSDSGHYRPTDANMTALLLALTMHGVSLVGINIYDHFGDYVGPAGGVLGRNMKWSKFEDSAALEEQDQDKANAVHKDMLRKKGETITTRKDLGDMIHKKKRDRGFLRF